MPFGHTFQLQFAELDVATVETRNQDLNSNSAQNDPIFAETNAAFNVLRRLEGTFVSGRKMGSRCLNWIHSFMHMSPFQWPAARNLSASKSPFPRPSTRRKSWTSDVRWMGRVLTNCFNIYIYYMYLSVFSQLNLIVFRTNACTISGIHPFWTKQLGFTYNATTVIVCHFKFSALHNWEYHVPEYSMINVRNYMWKPPTSHWHTVWLPTWKWTFYVIKLAFWINAIRCAVRWTRWTLTLTSQCWLWKLVCIVEPSHNTFINGFILVDRHTPARVWFPREMVDYLVCVFQGLGFANLHIPWGLKAWMEAFVTGTTKRYWLICWCECMQVQVRDAYCPRRTVLHGIKQTLEINPRKMVCTWCPFSVAKQICQYDVTLYHDTVPKLEWCIQRVATRWQVFQWKFKSSEVDWGYMAHMSIHLLYGPQDISDSLRASNLIAPPG